MQRITEKVATDKIPALSYIDRLFPGKKVMMFDIETTGLSADRSFIYLIGMNIRIDGQWHIELLFNDDGVSEEEIIRTFQEELAKHEILIEFNGDSFDIGFVRKRSDIIRRKLGHTLPDHFSEVTTVDLYKIFRPYKKALGLPNVKQKTIEQFLGINRVDQFNGGQLIDVYLNYLTNRSEKSKQLVIQHNRDDMEGMMYLMDIFRIVGITKGFFEVNELSMKEGASGLLLEIHSKLDSTIPSELLAAGDSVFISAKGDQLTMTVPVKIDTLKYYYSSGSSSYDEHKSYFIPYYGNDTNLMLYKTSAKDKKSYIELSDSFLGSRDRIKSYISCTAQSVIKGM